MARNHKFFFDADRIPRARGPAAEKTLMTFLETDVQGSDHVCHDLMDDLVAIEDGSDDQREFIGNAHRVIIDAEGVTIEPLHEADRDGEDGPGNAPIGSGGAGIASTTADSSSLSDREAAIAGAATSGGEIGPVAPPDEMAGAKRPASSAAYRTASKHFREVLEDWEAFILDDDPADDSLLLDDDYA